MIRWHRDDTPPQPRAGDYLVGIAVHAALVLLALALWAGVIETLDVLARSLLGLL